MKDWKIEFDELVEYLNADYGVKQYREFIQSLLEKRDNEFRYMIESLKDTRSLEDESNGRYNREIELRKSIEDIKNNLK